MFAKSIQKMFGVVVLSLTMVSTAVAAERAASIEYETVARPANLQPDFIAPSDANLRFLAIKTIDGSRVDAVLSQPISKTAASSTAVVSVHGSGGRYDTDPNGFLVRLLAGKGYAVLAINTRQSGARINTENFLEVRRDIEAAVYTARALGYRTIVLHGHSLGNIQVQYYAANNWDPDIKAVVLTGMFSPISHGNHVTCWFKTRRASLSCMRLRSNHCVRGNRRRCSRCACVGPETKASPLPVSIL